MLSVSQSQWMSTLSKTMDGSEKHYELCRHCHQQLPRATYYRHRKKYYKNGKWTSDVLPHIYAKPIESHSELEKNTVDCSDLRQTDRPNQKEYNKDYAKVRRKLTSL